MKHFALLMIVMASATSALADPMPLMVDPYAAPVYLPASHQQIMPTPDYFVPPSYQAPQQFQTQTPYSMQPISMQPMSMQPTSMQPMTMPSMPMQPMAYPAFTPIADAAPGADGQLIVPPETSSTQVVPAPMAPGTTQMTAPYDPVYSDPLMGNPYETGFGLIDPYNGTAPLIPRVRHGFRRALFGPYGIGIFRPLPGYGGVCGDAGGACGVYGGCGQCDMGCDPCAGSCRWITPIRSTGFRGGYRCFEEDYYNGYFRKGPGFDSGVPALDTLIHGGVPYDPHGIPAYTRLPRSHFGGWINLGYATKDNAQFLDQKDRVNVNQLWLFAERVADGRYGIDWGYRADVLYGTDADELQSFGNGKTSYDYSLTGTNIHGGYGWALPQMYLELAINRLSLKFGRFLSLNGYETAAAPDNFFYSHSYAYFNGEPRGHTGILGSFQTGPYFEWYAGWTLGWDTGFERNMGGGAFLGGFSTNMGTNGSFSYIVNGGDFGIHGTGYQHSLTWDTMITPCLNYVLQSNYVDATAYAPVGSNGGPTWAIGINQYLLWDINDFLALGTRAEWWRVDSTDTYSWTVGANLRPHSNIKIRPEVRYHWANQPAANNWNTAAGDHLNDTWSFGIDGILTF